jgi:hypothetical protein
MHIVKFFTLDDAVVFTLTRVEACYLHEHNMLRDAFKTIKKFAMNKPSIDRIDSIDSTGSGSDSELELVDVFK